MTEYELFTVQKLHHENMSKQGFLSSHLPQIKLGFDENAYTVARLDGVFTDYDVNKIYTMAPELLQREKPNFSINVGMVEAHSYEIIYAFATYMLNKAKYAHNNPSATAEFRAQFDLLAKELFYQNVNPQTHLNTFMEHMEAIRHDGKTPQEMMQAIENFYKTVNPVAYGAHPKNVLDQEAFVVHSGGVHPLGFESGHEIMADKTFKDGSYAYTVTYCDNKDDDLSRVQAHTLYSGKRKIWRWNKSESCAGFNFGFLRNNEVLNEIITRPNKKIGLQGNPKLRGARGIGELGYAGADLNHGTCKMTGEKLTTAQWDHMIGELNDATQKSKAVADLIYEPQP